MMKQDVRGSARMSGLGAPGEAGSRSSPIPIPDETLMKTRPLRILLVCEAETDADAIRKTIDGIGIQWAKLEWVSSLEAGHQAFAEDHHDVYLLDDRLGAQRGVELLAEARAIDCAKPVILLCGLADADTSAFSKHTAASDSLARPGSGCYCSSWGIGLGTIAKMCHYPYFLDFHCFSHNLMSDKGLEPNL